MTKVLLFCKRCSKPFEVRKGREYYKFCSRECLRPPPLVRLMSKVVKDEKGCWNFMGALREKNGYPQFKLNRQVISAHVASWMLHRGARNRLLVLHKCIKNKRCINPDHLYLGTHQDNSNDMVAQGHQRDQWGSKNNCAVLDEEKVRHIRSIPYYRGMYVYFSNLYGVELSVLRRAYLGKTWQNVK